ncbi:hypothetical protein K239x_20150 [Planctomycetes bacterium K23_9]|uniref:Uncharacterized protein n=1 Tax=Stieleria marina TaxID=1930275 RepID=A0A517NSG0_9BACT|nr:hypothetical protein K239x_20150 [Planctomycetes bacterium K23_9]
MRVETGHEKTPPNLGRDSAASACAATDNHHDVRVLHVVVGELKRHVVHLNGLEMQSMYFRRRRTQLIITL